MRVHVFLGCLFDVLGKVEVDGVGHLVIHFTDDRAISCADYVPVLRLRVEHDSTDRVLLALYSHNEFFILVSIGRYDVEK